MVEIEEPPGGKNGRSEFSLEKLNHLIKGQLKFLLLPDEDEGPFKSFNKISSEHMEHSHHTEDIKVIKTTVLNKSSCDCDVLHESPIFNANNNNNDEKTKGIGYKKGDTDWLRIFETFLCDIFMIAILPIIVPLISFNFLIRFLINFYYKLRASGNIRLMRGEDAFWASESPYNPGNFTSLYVIEGEADLGKIRRKLNSAWIERKDKKGNPMFTKLKLRAIKKFGYFAWQLHENFDLRHHIRHLHPSDPQRPIKESQLFKEISDIYDNILPDDKPQWEILLVPNYIYEGAKSGKKHYAIIFRIHHSIMDGLSAAQALRLVVADNVVQAGLDPMKPVRAPWYVKAATYFLALILTGPYLLRHNYVMKETNPFHGPGLKGPKTLNWSKPISLNALKYIKQKTGTSLTAIFTSAIGGAFRNLSMKKGLPAPKKLTAVTCAAMIPYPNIKAQNRFCVLFTPMDASLEGKDLSPVERVVRAQKPFENQFVGAAEVVMAYWITWIGGCFPIPVLDWLQDGICHGTVLLSNLPGPVSTTQIFGGHSIVDIVGWSPIRNRIGIAMCLFGYNGRLRANVIADSSVFPVSSDVDNLIMEFEREILSLGKSLGLREQDCFFSDVAPCPAIVPGPTLNNNDPATTPALKYRLKLK